METQIFKLDRDVVLDIFLINADMECATEDRFPAVHTLRHTSQVCSAWRNLILSSPSLWARVIDFNFLRNRRWRKKVLNRTGGYALSVRGGTADQEVVIPFLAENWSRIRSLTLSFVRSSSENLTQDTRLWNLLARSANVLESFQLSLRTTELDYWAAQPIFSPPDFTLFDNHAPLLKRFSAWGINWDKGADWAPQLRHLEVSHPIPIYELLKALSHLPLLETLLIKERGRHAIARRDVEGSRPLPKIAVPRLKNIEISSRMDITCYMVFLAQLEPVYGRVLTFDSSTSVDRYISDPRLASGISAVSEVLSTYSNQAGLATSTRVTLELDRYLFSFKALLPAQREFCFSLDFYPSFLVKEKVDQLFFALDPPIFYHVRMLYLCVHREYGIPPTDPHFINFLGSFPSLQILETTPVTLDYLLGLPEDVLKSAFPVLQEIKIDLGEEEEQEVVPIRAFILSRRVLGVPISVLTVRRSSWSTSENLRSLKERAGVTVMEI